MIGRQVKMSKGMIVRAVRARSRRCNLLDVGVVSNFKEESII